MSTTDQRTGFRLPWSADGRARDAETDAEATDSTDDPASQGAESGDPEASFVPDGAAADGETADGEMTWPEVDRRVRQQGRRAVDRADAALAEITSGTPTATARRTNALMAGLSKAMHTAAESARVETLERLAADAAARTEAIKSTAAEEAAAIKQAADDDVAGVREWSKAELARVRDETETRIATRREALERETEAHAAKVEARIERVKRIVAAFEASMAEFFTTLMAESDPARVALLAEQLPEAPSLEVDDELEAAYEAFEAESAAAEGPAANGTHDTLGAVADDTDAHAVVDAFEPADELVGDAPSPAAVETFEAADDLIGDAATNTTDPEDGGELDAESAAEAEAAAFAAAEDAPDEVDETGSNTATTALSEEALAAQLARMEIADASNVDAIKTELVVTGLVSVAGIAGFKREITRIAGVSGVGVTSGPGGEFVYSVSHDPETDFRAAIAALPGFAAKITGETEGSLQITASDHNPEN